MDGEKEVKPVEEVKEIDPVEAMGKQVLSYNDDASSLADVEVKPDAE